MEPKKLKADSFINNLWMRSADKKEDWSWLEKPKRIPSYESLLKSEWDEEFWEQCLSGFSFQKDFDVFKSLARNRMVMGAFRYGLLADKNYLKYDNKSGYYRRIDLADESLNLECYIDAYNIAFLHYMCDNIGEGVSLARRAMSEWDFKSENPRWEFKAEDDGEHCVKKEEQ